MITKILRISNQFKNSKNGGLNETTIYNQFKLNDPVKINQNLYNDIKDQKKQLKAQTLNINFTIKSCTNVTGKPKELNLLEPTQKLSITVVVHSDLCHGEHE